MYGDFSRNSFDPTKAFSGVLFQQGRPYLDSELNEQAAVAIHLLRTALRDLIGRHGGPADAADLGFALAASRSALEALLAGRPSDFRSDVVASAAERLAAGDILISPGRYYVDGILVENTAPCWLSDQPAFALSLDEDPAQSPLSLSALKECPHLLYLEVWERTVDALEDPELREVALGGADTSVRTRVAWQVGASPLNDGLVGSESDSLLALLDQNAGAKARCTLKARTRPQEAQDGDALAGYTGAENRHYRVEIHAIDDAGEPRLKWSRSNAAMSVAVTGWSVLEEPGREVKLRLELGSLEPAEAWIPGAWVEVLNSCLVAGARAGALARVRESDRNALSLIVEDPSGRVKPILERQGRAFLRAWDHPGDPNAEGAISAVVGANGSDHWLALENGIEVAVAGGPLRPGDYWLIPARASTGQILWPIGPAPETTSAALPPHGIHRHVAPLAVIDRAGNLRDLRRRFWPLAQ